jgi:hypothetical protein
LRIVYMTHARLGRANHEYNQSMSVNHEQTTSKLGLERPNPAKLEMAISRQPMLLLVVPIFLPRAVIVVTVIVTAMQKMSHPVSSLRPRPDIALECIC